MYTKIIIIIKIDLLYIGRVNFKNINFYFGIIFTCITKLNIYKNLVIFKIDNDIFGR